MGHNGIRRLLGFLEWIQLGILLPTIYPAAYLVIVDREDSMILPLFLVGTLILLPALIAKLAIRYVTGFVPYALICTLAVALMVPVSGFLRDVLNMDGKTYAGARIALLIETVLVMLTYISIRLRENSRLRALKENDSSWTEKEYLLEKAQFPLLIWFVILYAISRNFDSGTGCDVALFAFFAYGAIACLDRHLRETEQYIKMLSYVRQLPAKRVRMIGLGYVLTFLLIAGIAAGLPAAATAGIRSYRDLRQWLVARTGPSPVDLYGDPLEMATPEDLYADLMRDGQYEFVPEWVDQLVRVLGYIFLGGFAILLIRLFWKFCGAFRDRSEDNGDIAATLEADTIEKLPGKAAVRRRDNSERERIRRRYRHVIRSRRRGYIPPCETPAEIESGAGLGDSPEDRALHTQYEKARYDA